MGFKVGKFPGGLASKAIGTATHGLVTPNFSRPTARPGTADSTIVTSRGIVPWQTTRTAIYTQPGGTQVDGVSQGLPTGPGPGMQMVPFDAAGVMAYCAAKAGRRGIVKVPSPCPGFHWNTGRYYVFGDCRTGSPAGEVTPFTRLVRNRRINPANGKAAMRALRRVSATHHLLVALDKHLQKVARRATSHRGAQG